MGVFHSKKSNEPKKLTPDMAGYRPSKDWWPDLTDYKKAIMLHNISMNDLETLLIEYTKINADAKKVKCEFLYALFPEDTSWVYLEFPSCEGITHYQTFWNYQNLTVWLSQKSDKEFCLAIPNNQSFPLFLSTRDTKNPCGDSCLGIYADRDFYFDIPASVFEWGPVPTSCFDYVGYLKTTFAFDTQWLSKINQMQIKQSEMVLSFEEE